jgi:tetratricopeptide (TPR) repeat protein
MLWAAFAARCIVGNTLGAANNALLARETLSERPPPQRPHGAIVRSLAEAKRWDDVLKHAALWLSEQPDHPGPHCAMAGALIQLKRHAEAASHALEALNAHADLPLAHQLLAEARYYLDDYPGALASIRTALMLDPDDANLHFLLARVNLHLGQLGEAFVSARRARELDPDDADYAHLVILLERLGASSAQSVYNEIAELKQALALEPENAQILGRIGERYADGLEDYAQAEEFLRQALAIEPDNRSLQSSLFEVVTERDVIYKALGLPLRALIWVGERVWSPAAIPMFLVLAAGAAATVPIALWLLAAAILFFPAQKIYAWLMRGDLVAHRTQSLALARALRFVHRWPVLVRGGLVVTLVGACWSATLYLVGISPWIGWPLVLLTFAFFCGLAYHRRSSRQAETVRIAALAEQGVVLADVADDDGIVRAEIVGEPEQQPSLTGVLRGMRPESQWLMGITLVGVVGGILIVCGGGGYYGIQSVGDRRAQEVAELVRDHPIILEQLGGLERCEFNLLRDLDEGSRSRDVYEVHGPKGSGVLTVHEFLYQYDSIKLRIGKEEWELLDETREDSGR